MRQKRCPKCKELKSTDEFCNSNYTKDKLNVYCKPCVKIYKIGYYQKHKEVESARNRKWFKDHPERQKEYNLNYKKKHGERKRNLDRKSALSRKYGTTQEEIDELNKKQGGKCAICSVNGKLHVDHCHKIKIIRGLLCGKCNRGIGMFNDLPHLLIKGAEYLERQ